MLTNQEFFTQAVTGVIKQGKRSANDGGRCLYRGPNGLKCAVGQAIPDDVYDPMWDQGNGKSIHFLTSSKLLPTLAEVDATLMSELQHAHDHCDDPATFVEDFTRIASRIADQFNLVMPEV